MMVTGLLRLVLALGHEQTLADFWVLLQVRLAAFQLSTATSLSCRCPQYRMPRPEAIVP